MGDAKEPGKNRLQAIRDIKRDPDYVPPMPPLEATYLVKYLFEIGPVVPAGMGASRISNQEMLAWQSLSGVDLTPWEARILRLLSGDYLAESDRAKKGDCEAPWEEDVVATKLATRNMRDSIVKMSKL